ncbi:helix-turn-helix transcriptional regulator [Porphyromonas gingivalis]|uniref:helix-turn-helix transcriptional regulator n=1 Tax=Porphyromonas gingivalis TaxID=837 RepID=UPI0003AD2C6B|nr:helix-turn-helix transcriptional regulator [Porphyromonas gingivalis]ERJ89107.1 DNA-binding helix-turn-helix protein [Porphyromonas gingivalis F0566]MCE8165678.1 helix-turn-helix transcriptional regulator [Porphyromonas gingivalis]MCE8181107.1 helix-turn-helix transcriptional regulator [Porphyromonas gingivalis]
MAMNRIKAVLAEKLLTSKWLAGELGKAENTVSRWCSNKVQPSLEILSEIAEILDIDIHELIASTKKD